MLIWSPGSRLEPHRHLETSSFATDLAKGAVGMPPSSPIRRDRYVCVMYFWTRDAHELCLVELLGSVHRQPVWDVETRGSESLVGDTNEER